MKRSKTMAVREPVQVYLAQEDSALLARLSAESGLSKAEVLRRGIRSFAAERGSASSMLRFMDEESAGEWPTDVAREHDRVLAEAHTKTRKRR